MPNTPRELLDSSTSGSDNPLTDRVRARVAEAARNLDQHTRRPRARKALQEPTLHTPKHTREARSLRRVFKELAVTHREYRVRTGQRASPALRNAAKAFKQSPSLPSLVVVAAFLDEDGLLAW